MSAVSLTDDVAVVLRELEIAALRARYRMLKDMGIVPFPWFYCDLPELQDGRIARGAEAKIANELSRSPKILLRRTELWIDGIKPLVTIFPDVGPPRSVSIHVILSERGRRVLEGSGFALSEAIRAARKFVWVGYYVVAIVLLLVIFSDRFAHIGWGRTLAGLSLVVLAALLIQRAWRARSA